MQSTPANNYLLLLFMKWLVIIRRSFIASYVNTYEVNYNFTPKMCWATAAVLNSSPRASPLCTFRCYSYHFRRLFIRTQVPCEVDLTRYSSMSPVRATYSIHSALKCARREFKFVYMLQTYMMSHSSVRKMLRNANPWYECSGSRSNGSLCREHVNRNTVHSWSALLTSWLSESGVLTKRDMKNM